jgi:hypothetical protein
MTPDPDFAPTLGAVMFTGWLMVRSGVAKRMFEWRRPEHRCAACGRPDRDCGCLGK